MTIQIENNLDGYFRPEIRLVDDPFDITISENNVEIVCEWDHGWGGRGTESIDIPLDVLKDVIRQYEESLKTE